jgi:hypothetical protein
MSSQANFNLPWKRVVLLYGMIPIAFSPICMMPLNYSSHLISLQSYVEMAEITLKQRRNQKAMKLKFDAVY